MSIKKIDRNDYFNPDGDDINNEKLFGSKPTGFLDFNRPRYSWSKKIYDLMENNSWFPTEVNTATEQKDFALLSPNEQEIYKYTFAQLSFNDSAQANYLLDFNRLATNQVVRAALTLQAMQEANHSKSYAVLLDAAGNSDEVFNLYKHDDALREKNERIADQFAHYINGNTANDMLLSAMASVNLEGIYFLTGFAFIFVLGDKVPGARDMIAFISRDEIGTHLPIFANIYKVLTKENQISSKVHDRAIEMIEEAVDIELTYGKYLADRFPILGITYPMIERTVKNYANERLRAIGLPALYPVTDKTNLQKLVDKHTSFNTTKTNFFEGNVRNYTKAINFDDF